MAKPKFGDLYFGRSDSKNELAGDRDEFIKSFVDLNRITEDVISGDKTLILGPKGTILSRRI